MNSISRAQLKKLHCDTIDVQTSNQGWDLLTLQKLLCRVKGDTSPQYGKQIQFWKTVSQPGAYIDGIIRSHKSMSGRDGWRNWRYQNGWIFGKVRKGGGGGHFQSKSLCCRFLAKNLGLKNMSVLIKLMSRIFPFELELILGLTQLLLKWWKSILSGC